MTPTSWTYPMRLAGAALLVAVLTAACGHASGKAGAASTRNTPAEFRAACGHPGATVEVKVVPVVVPRAACDLTGVVLLYAGVGVTVPAEGGATAQADGPAGGKGLTASVDPKTQDVTIST